MVSLVQAHYINQGIRENKKLSVNVVDASWLKMADKMGTISGNIRWARPGKHILWTEQNNVTEGVPMTFQFHTRRKSGS